MRPFARCWQPWLLGMLAVAASACGAASPAATDAASDPGATTAPSVLDPSDPASGAVTPPPPPTAAPAPPTEARGGPVLERTHTGQAEPTVVVDNAYSLPQHVFLDARWLGRVEPGGSGTFAVPLGVHTFTSADSSDPDDNPASITEPFETGYRYHYAIAPR